MSLCRDNGDDKKSKSLYTVPNRLSEGKLHQTIKYKTFIITDGIEALGVMAPQAVGHHPKVGHSMTELKFCIRTCSFFDWNKLNFCGTTSVQ